MRCLLGELWCGWFLETHSIYTYYRILNLSYITQKDRVEPVLRYICLAAYKTFIYVFVPSLDQDKIMLQSPGISYFKTKWNQQLILCMGSRIIKIRGGKTQYLELTLELYTRSQRSRKRDSEHWQRAHVFTERKDLGYDERHEIFMNFLSITQKTSDTQKK